MRIRQVVLALWLLCVVSLAGNAAHAASPSEQSLAQADTHFKQGVQLFKQGAFEGALVEFRKAHELVPDFRVQFNIGRSCAELRDAACALRAYRSYLASVGQLAPERVSEVQAEIVKLEPLVGTVRLSTSATGAALSLDDVALGTAPLAEPLLVNVGRHRVSARLADGISDTRVIEVASGELKEVILTPEAKADSPVARPPPVWRVPSAPAPAAKAPVRESSKVWVGWAASGALAVAAGSTGVLALSARSQAKHDARQVDATAALDAANRRTHTLAAVTDVLFAAAAVTAGITLYFTLRSPSAHASGPPRVSLALTARAVELGGSF